MRIYFEDINVNSFGGIEKLLKAEDYEYSFIVCAEFIEKRFLPNSLIKSKTSRAFRKLCRHSEINIMTAFILIKRLKSDYLKRLRATKKPLENAKWRRQRRKHYAD